MVCTCLVEELVSKGRAVTPHGHAARMIAFGSAVGGADEPHLRVPLGHVTRYLEHWIDEHGNVMGHTQLKDPVLAFLVALGHGAAGIGRGVTQGSRNSRLWRKRRGSGPPAAAAASGRWP